MIILIRLLHKLGLLSYFNFNYQINVNNNKTIIPIINGLGVSSTDLSEKWMINLLSCLFVFRKGLFVDVGVNTGQTLIKLKSVDSEIDYIGFEPNPTCCYYVSELVRLNRFLKVDIYPFALSERSEVIKLNYYTKDVTDSSASMVDAFRNQEVFYQKNISCHSFSEVRINEKISFLKIDVEGAELEVINGLIHKVNTDKPIILMEILPAYSSANSARVERQDELFRILVSIGYKFYRLHKSYSNISNLELIDKIDIHSNLDWCEYLILPSDFEVKELSTLMAKNHL
jgi:FkbM family methyltransferase